MTKIINADKLVAELEKLRLAKRDYTTPFFDTFPDYNITILELKAAIQNSIEEDKDVA